MTETLHIRTATVADATQLYEWDKEPHVQAAVSNSGTTSFDAEWEEELGAREDGTLFLIAEIDGKPIGAMQIIDPATERSHYWGAIAGNLRAIDIWIGQEEFLGKGHGTRMMRYAIEQCFSDESVAAILIDPLMNNKPAHRFYERLGFSFVERRQFDDESDCAVYRLERKQWACIRETIPLGLQLNQE